MVSAADQAGMEGIDRAAIDAIILRESGDSPFMRQQRRRDGRVDARIAAFRERLLRAREARETTTSNNSPFLARGAPEAD